MQYDIKEEAHMSLDSLLLPTMNSMHDGIEEEAYTP
jgi:hypothetical protein